MLFVLFFLCDCAHRGQVDPGHDAAISGFPALTGVKKEPKPLEASSVMNQRHMNFVQRGRVAGESTWRPKKIYRLSAKHWLGALDCQLRHSTASSGLVSFKYDKDPHQLTKKCLY